MSSEPPSYDSLYEASPSLSSPSSFVYPIVSEADQIAATDSYRDLLTLPDDVVEQVFVHACQPTLDPRSSIQWKRDFYPLWLGKICRAWREFAWACSVLWTYIVIRIDRDKEDLGKQISLLKSWIQRAKGRPLSIYIVERPHARYTGTKAAVNSRMHLLALLSQYSKQWRRIDADLPYRYFLSPGMHFPSADSPSRRPFLNLSLPLLQYVSISIPDARHDAELQLNLNQAPLLRVLSVTYFVEAGLLSCCPTKQITRLTLNSCSINLKDLFRQFPKLTELTWNNTTTRRLPPVPLAHDCLQTFDIDLEHIPHFVFHSFCFPALKSLSIGTSSPLTYTQVLDTFFKQSGCTLTSLTIACQIKEEHDLIELLSSNSISSSLQELYIRSVRPRRDVLSEDEYAELGLTRTFFDMLHPDEDPNYLNRLEILEYEGPLTVQAIDFIEPLIIRSRIRDLLRPAAEGMAILKRAKIKADQFSVVSQFSIAEYPDSQYVWEVLRMLDEGVLVLSNMDGSVWE